MFLLALAETLRIVETILVPSYFFKFHANWILMLMHFLESQAPGAAFLKSHFVKVFSCTFAAYFQNTFSSEHLWRTASEALAFVCASIKWIAFFMIVLPSSKYSKLLLFLFSRGLAYKGIILGALIVFQCWWSKTGIRHYSFKNGLTWNYHRCIYNAVKYRRRSFLRNQLNQWVQEHPEHQIDN